MNCKECTGNCDCSYESSNNEDKSIKLPLISSAFFILTQACNLKCKYCFVQKNPSSMTYQIAKDATDFLIKNAEIQNEIPSINFFGGEPTLKWDDIIVPLVNYIRNEYAKPFDLSMTSNCLLMDDEKIKFLKDNDIDLLFSIDGDKATQDYNRPCVNGDSSFDILKDKIPKLLEFNPRLNFRMTLDHDNCKEMVNNYKFAADNGFKDIISIINEFAEWTEEEKLELKQAMSDLAEYFMDLMRIDEDVRIFPFVDAFRKIKTINQFHKDSRFRDISTNLAYGKCGMGASKFASVGTDGTLYSCQEMVGNKEWGDKFVIGDIYNGTDDNKRMEIINKYDVKKVICKEQEMCNNCKLYNICDGSCVINNYFITGDMNIVPSIQCYYFQLCIEEATRIINIMAEEENEFFKNIFLKI